MKKQILLDRYVIEDLLGQGGMGTVYYGTDTQSGKPVAIKVLNPDIVSSNPEAVVRFTREAEALRALNHPNIVKVLATAQEGDQHYLVMEFVGGGSLRDKLSRETKISVTSTLEIALDLADAITRAHRLGVIHRDIKPTNVLLAEDGTPRLTDFGIAHISDSSRLTQAGTVIGTIHYLSPEACQGAEADVRTDIWAFGIMLYEMLTGQVPFDADNPLAMVMAIINEPIPDLQALRPDAPTALIDIIYRMLEKEHQARIPSVRLVATELEAIIQGMVNPAPIVEFSRFATPTPVSPEIPQNNLPSQTTIFIGRQVELAELAGLFANPNTRLVTILGPGGMGKTRLALETAKCQLNNFEQGVYFVPLAPLSSAMNIPPAVAEAVGLKFFSNNDLIGQLIRYFANKEVLLVLDNFEHVLDGANLLSELLRGAPGVKVLATSQEKLNLHEEIRFRIEGLDYPDLKPPKDRTLNIDQLTTYSAVKLFLEVAQRASPGFELDHNNLIYITRICQILEGMPLGILMAAAWVDLFSPREIADEISHNLDFLATELLNVPERQRSIRVIFDSSWSRLTETERQVFMKLSVFHGGFTREAAQAVARADLRSLIRLVNKSILRRDPGSGRYELHELLRQYAWEKLEAAKKTSEIQDAHCTYYIDFLKQRRSFIHGKRQVETLTEIETEFENVRRSWSWAVQNKMYAAIESSSEILYVFCEGLSRYQDGENLFQNARQMLTPHPDEEPQPAWGRVLLPWYDLRTEGRGRLEDKTNIRAQAEIALTAAQKHDDHLGMAYTYVLLGAITEDEGDETKAIYFYEEGLTHDPKIDESFWVLIRLGLCYRKAGKFEDEIRCFRQNLKRGREIGDKIKIAWSLFNIGETLIIKNELLSEPILTEIENYWRESNKLFRQVGSLSGVIWTNTNLSLIAFTNKDFIAVKNLSEESLSIANEYSLSTFGRKEAFGMLGNIAVLEGDYDQGKQLLYDWLVTKPEMHQVIKSVVYCRPAMMLMILPSLAIVLSKEGKEENAVELLSLAYNHPATHTGLLDIWPSIQNQLTELQKELGSEIYNKAWTRGQSLEFDETMKSLKQFMK